MPPKPMPHMERFYLSTVIPSDPDGCWEWVGRKCTLGYGHTSGTVAQDGTRNPKAHRFAYSRLVGQILAGMVVRHKCDNRGCVNPRHLEIGTQQDNIRDRVQRGRNGFPVKQRKLEPQQIEEIRLAAERGDYQRDIAQRFKVSQRTVAKIIHRLNGYARY